MVTPRTQIEPTHATLKQQISDAAMQTGAVAVGFAQAGPVDTGAIEAYARFLDDEGAAEMPYLANYREIRANPLRLFEPPATEGSVICMAFPYWHPRRNPLFARYAQGADYHRVLRKKLKPLARLITDATGARARVCVDTAPILERYWAVRSGIGFMGLNRCLIVPGAGSWVFLAEIVTEAVFEPDKPCTLSCRGCNACLRRCPGKALSRHGVSAARCHSCLSIEHRGPLPEGTALKTPYGCDICQTVCPHNAAPAPGLPEFAPAPAMLALTRADLASLTPDTYAALFGTSAITRCPLDQLHRNLRFV